MWEPLPTPYTPGDTHSDPVPGHVRAEVMQTGEEGRERGHSPQPPAGRGGCWHEGGGPLEARDERAAGRPWAHAGGLRTQPRLLGRRAALGFCLLRQTRLSCSGDTRGRGTSEVRTYMQEDTLIHTHRPFYPRLSNPPSSSQSRHPALWSLAGSPTHSLSPQPSMAPYCLERKSRLPTLTSGALPDMAWLRPHGPE